MHKNTLKKPNSQYTLTLSHPQDKKTLFFLLMRLLGYYEFFSSSHSLLFLYHKPNIYIYIYIGQLVLGIIILVEFGFLILLVFGLEEWIRLGNSSHTRPTSTGFDTFVQFALGFHSTATNFCINIKSNQRSIAAKWTYSPLLLPYKGLFSTFCKGNIYSTM